MLANIFIETGPFELLILRIAVHQPIETHLNCYLSHFEGFSANQNTLELLFELLRYSVNNKSAETGIENNSENRSTKFDVSAFEVKTE